MSLYAETNGFVEYDDRSHKLLSDNRELYMRQSAMTVNGRVPTPEEVRASFQPHRQDETAASRGALADGGFLRGECAG